MPAANAPGAAEPLQPDMTGEMPRHPETWESYVVLANGRPCLVRPTAPSDSRLLGAFFGTLSDETLRLRYFTLGEDMAAREAAKLAAADQVDHVALVAIQRGAVVGVASYDVVRRASAEVAFTVCDAMQGTGLGSLLLEQLAAIARENGIYRFSADVLADNKAMLGVFEAAGYQPTKDLHEGVVKVDFSIDPTAVTREISHSRERRADVASVTPLVAPRAVALVVDNADPGTAGGALIDAVGALEYGGFVGVVDPSGAGAGGWPGYTSVVDCPAEVDLAVVAVSHDRLSGVIADCAAARVRCMAVVRGPDDGGEDLALQVALVRQVRGEGMRLFGPRALGVTNTDPRVLLNASLARTVPIRGRVGVFTMGAAFGDAVLAECERHQLGATLFAGSGSAGDLSINELMQHWAEDEATGVVVAHLEMIANPRKFIRVARRVSVRKPVVVLRAGRGTRTLQSALVGRTTELPAAAIEQILAAAGVIQVDTIRELADTAALLSLQPLPEGDRVAVITDSYSLGRLALDSAAGEGLSPVDDAIYFDGSRSDMAGARDAIGTQLANPAVDMVVILCSACPGGDCSKLGGVIAELARNATKPVISVMLARPPTPMTGEIGPHGLPAHGAVPVFADVDAAFHALRLAVRHGEWLRTPPGEKPDFPDIERQRARTVVNDRMRRRRGVSGTSDLNAAEVGDILAAYGIDLWPAVPVRSEEQAVMAAHSIGFPVVLKSRKSRYRNPIESGAVRLNLENERAVRTAFLSTTATLSPEARAALVVQRMAPPGVSCVVDALEDPLFGPVIRFRLGGAATRATSDFGYVVPQIGTREADRLIRIPAAAPVLLDAAAQDADAPENVDLVALADLIMRVGRMADDLPEIAFLSLKPLLVHARGVAVLGAAAKVARPVARTTLEARRL